MNEHYDAYRYETTAYNITSTRWASEEEIKESLTKVRLLDKHYPACGLPLISDGRIAYVNNSDSHSLIFGSTGSKKSRLFVMPMMEMIARAGESVVCTDPKGELYRRTSGFFAQEGYDIKVLNLRDPSQSNGWNPLQTALKYHQQGKTDITSSLIGDLSYSIFSDRPGSKEDPFWNQKSRAIFQGLCHMLLNHSFFNESQVTLSSVLDLAMHLDSASDSCDNYTTNDLLKFYDRDSLARINMDSAILGDVKTVMNIHASFMGPMQLFFSRQSLVKMLSTNDISFESLGLQKSALYIIMPDEKTTLHSLVSLAIKQCYEILIDVAQSTSSLSLPYRVNFLLDEFSNLPQIPDMGSMISAARSRNIRFYLVIQSMQQLSSKYGEDSHTIRGNCTDWVYLTSRELSLLKELEDLCGHDPNTRIPLISVSQLQRLNKETGEALILCGRMYPYLSHLADIDNYPFSHLPMHPLPQLPDEAPSRINIRAMLAKPRSKKDEERLRKLMEAFWE